MRKYVSKFLTLAQRVIQSQIKEFEKITLIRFLDLDFTTFENKGLQFLIAGLWNKVGVL